MSPEENKALIRRFIEAGNRGNVTDFSTTGDELFVPDFIRHDPAGDERLREDYKRHLLSLHDAHPGQLTIEDLIAEGDQMVVRFTARGTNPRDTVAPRPHPATGKQYTVTGIAIARLANGQFVEMWHQVDWLGWRQQLGLIPPSGPAS